MVASLIPATIRFRLTKFCLSGFVPLINSVSSPPHCVISAAVRSTVGYIGGHKEHPAYEEVKAHTTGHAEATLVEFDAEQTSFTELCKLFFEIHDPAQTDGQGPDIGPQYRSEIFYLNDKQKEEAEAVIALLREKGYEVNTKLTPATTFWEGEEYHQHYYDKTGGEPYCHIRVKKF